MIKACYPFEIKKINSIEEYLFVLKNLLRLVHKNGINKKTNGKLFAIKFHKEEWKIDFSLGKERKFKSIEIVANSVYSNETEKSISIKIKNIIADKNFISICKKFKVLSNYNKSLAFVYENSIIYPLGLFKEKTESIFGSFEIVDNKNIVEVLLRECLSMKSLSLKTIKFSYLNAYNEFLSFISNKNIEFSVHGEACLKEYLDLKINNNSKKLKFVEYCNLINSKKMPSNSYIFYFIIYYITIEFTKFINNNISIDFNSCIILNDFDNKKIIKLPSFFCNNLDVVKDKEEFLQPLLPVRF